MSAVAPPAARATPTLFFLHVPKAGGSTLLYVLARQYAADRTYKVDPRDVSRSIEELRQLPDEHKRRLDLVMGHMIYGVDQVVPQDCVWVTMLRDPVARIVSFYGYIRSWTKHYLHERVMEMTLEEFVRDDDVGSQLHDWQTAAIAGLGAESTCSEVTFERALRNIRNHFAVVGRIERFDESVLLMRRALGWRRTPFYVRFNVGREGPAVPDELAAEISRRNAFDERLVEWADRQLDQRIAEEGRSFGRELARFRALNPGFGIARRARRLTASRE